MLYANVHVDLPSEELLRRKTALEWLAGLIGRTPDLRSGEDISTVTGLSVFRRIVAALEQLGVDDVLSVIVDRRAVYVDTDESSGDLATAVAELDARRILEEPVEAMDLILSHRDEEAGLHVLVEVRLRRRVPVGAPELELAFAGRLTAMQIHRGETPAEFAARLRALAGDAETLAATRERFEAFCSAAVAAIEAQLGELALSLTASPVALRLIRPGPRALDHFRRLTWGPSVRLPRYRPVPVRNRRGAYDEPFYHHYFDPYFDFVAWVTIVEIIGGRGWSGLEFEIVDEDGARAFGPEDAAGATAVAGVADEAVRIVGDELIVDASVPELGGVDPGEIADPRLVPGYGGSGREDDGAAGGWDEAPLGVDGADLGGSCGASCGGCGSG